MSVPDGVTIRRCLPADAEALTDLHLDCWDDAYTGLMPQEVLDARRTSVPERVERWREILSRSRNTQVAEAAGGDPPGHHGLALGQRGIDRRTV